ncbi:MAG TPA: autotransporter assembly complex family protein [Steroidobacteraceae bacterium]|nr:autotransporter assembly complex family protein [Steroidobacteraceae bacterium]
MKSLLPAALVCLWWAPPLHAERVSVAVEGVEGDVLESVRASIELRQYEDRDVSAVEVRRLFERAEEQARTALEPFGYYSAEVSSKLERPEPGQYRATLRITPGEPVIVRKESVIVSGEAAQLPPVKAALERFQPRQGERLDHGAYERSKQEIIAALADQGYIRAEMVKHRVEVVRAANSAEIELEWQPGPRHRFGAVHYSEAQFPDDFLQRYTPWRQGEFYSADKLLELQQKLVDADYFSAVAVTPDFEHVKDAVVPVDVVLVPAKRTVYTASLYVSTDTGPGTKLGFERRWLNRRGHKLSSDIQYSTRLEDFRTQYVIPQPGLRNRTLTFGVGYRDEETDSSTSRMARAAATQVTDRWKGFTRTLGLQYLNGDFEIADRQHSTSLLYAEGLLTRKKANDLYFPLSGYSLLYGVRLAAESPLSDTSLAQLRAEAKWLQQVGEHGRVIVRGAVGGMVVDNFDALPPELRFFAGGDRSIRGFDYQQIGDTNALGEVIGGKYETVGSAEYEHYFLEKWGAAVFVDAGDAFTRQFDVNVGAGIGLRWKSPVGLVRLDIARPVVSDFDHSWRIHLVIGPDL